MKSRFKKNKNNNIRSKPFAWQVAPSSFLLYVWNYKQKNVLPIKPTPLLLQKKTFAHMYYYIKRLIIRKCRLFSGRLNWLCRTFMSLLKDLFRYGRNHSMATAILKKSKDLVTNTTAASKYIPRRPRISIHWNPPFQTSFHKISKEVFLE